jgi:hypothetical protein
MTRYFQTIIFSQKTSTEEIFDETKSKLKIYMKENLYQIWGLFEQTSSEISSSAFYNQSTFVVLQPWKGKGLKKYFL